MNEVNRREIYQNSLNRRRKTMDQKKLRPQSWPEYPAPLSLPIAYVSDDGTQMDNITCDHELEINDQVKNKLIVLQKQLLKYNKHLTDSCKIWLGNMRNELMLIT